MYDDFGPGIDGPAHAGRSDPLTNDERTVGAAYARLVPLCEALRNAPFARHLYQELQDYLDEEAWEAADAFERLRNMGPAHLTARLNELAPESLDEDLE